MRRADDTAPHAELIEAPHDFVEAQLTDGPSADLFFPRRMPSGEGATTGGREGHRMGLEETRL